MPTTTNLALRMLILTAVRSGPLRFMRYDQIEDDIWTIPAHQMKGRLGQTADFRVPLSGEAQRGLTSPNPSTVMVFSYPAFAKE
ncbi:hypothetical protein [Ruegeria faecimaris]|uniref:hypothetical protein n=1 Tax=Ruegeria faecimaris TaxID=686389 RepID=UPI00319E7E38